MTDPERIYLQPECCADPIMGRIWCRDDVFTGECDEGAKPTEYVRADLYDDDPIHLALFKWRNHMPQDAIDEIRQAALSKGGNDGE